MPDNSMQQNIFRDNNERIKNILDNLNIEDLKLDMFYESRSDTTDLHIAVLASNEILVDLLLKNGADINETDDNQGRTALYLATLCNNEEMVDFLLDRHADVGRYDLSLVTPLHIAAEIGNERIADSLLKHGANIDAVDENGCTALHYSVSRNNEDISEFLINKKANVRIADFTDITPLHIASEKGSARTVKLLLKSDPSIIDQRDEFDCTAFDIATRNGNDNVAKLLSMIDSIKNITDLSREDLLEMHDRNSDNVSTDSNELQNNLSKHNQSNSINDFKESESSLGDFLLSIKNSGHRLGPVTYDADGETHHIVKKDLSRTHFDDIAYSIAEDSEAPNNLLLDRGIFEY